MDADAVNLSTALARLAERLHDEIGASSVLLFGSRARGSARPESDVELIVVSKSFSGVPPLSRARGPRSVWRDVGGRVPLDLVCVTPDELSDALARPTLLAEVVPSSVDVLSSAIVEN
jgi:hypothetical protein